MESKTNDFSEEFPIYPADENSIRKMADGTGLSYNSIKNTFRKGGKLKLFYNSFEELNKNYDEKKFEQDICKLQLNEEVNNGFFTNVLHALTSVEEIILKAVEEKRNFADDYNSWFKLGINIKFFQPDEKGLNLFKSVSALSPKYNEKECEKLWKSLKPEYGNIGTIINLIEKEKFIIPKDRKKFLREE